MSDNEYDEIDVGGELDEFDEIEVEDGADLANFQVKDQDDDDEEDDVDADNDDVEQDPDQEEDPTENDGSIVASDYFHKILEQSSQNKDYIHSVSVEAKESLIVKTDERRTRRFITKKEYARIIGVRTKLIALYAKVFVDVTNIIDPKIMAIKEIKEKKCPLMLKREIGTGKDGRKICELWSVNEMIVPFD